MQSAVEFYLVEEPNILPNEICQLVLHSFKRDTVFRLLAARIGAGNIARNEPKWAAKWKTHVKNMKKCADSEPHAPLYLVLPKHTVIMRSASCMVTQVRDLRAMQIAESKFLSCQSKTN